MGLYRQKLIFVGIGFSVILFLLIMLGTDIFKNNWKDNPAPIVYFSLIGLITIITIIFTIYQYYKYRKENNDETNPLLDE